MFISVLTSSDRCFKGLCEDESGQLISRMLSDQAETLCYAVVPDEQDIIEQKLKSICDTTDTDILFTTGGTGFSSRDVVPEATKAVIEREVPGIAEAIRAESLRITPRAMLSRATAGIRAKTLIINLPGSPKAVREALEIIMPVLAHAVQVLSGVTLSCGKENP